MALDEYNKNLKILEEMKDRLKKEKKDVTNLESMSLSSFSIA